MKRDMDLIREILLFCEKKNEKFTSSKITLEGETYTQAQITYHVRILWQEGLIDGKNASSLSQEDYLIRGLTYEGHNLIDSIRDATVWHKTKDTLAKVGGSASMAVIQQIATKTIAQILGIGG